MRDLTFFNDGNKKRLKNGLYNFSKLRTMVYKVSMKTFKPMVFLFTFVIICWSCSLKSSRDIRGQSTSSLQKIRQESSAAICGACQNQSKYSSQSSPCLLSMCILHCLTRSIKLWLGSEQSLCRHNSNHCCHTFHSHTDFMIHHCGLNQEKFLLKQMCNPSLIILFFCAFLLLSIHPFCVTRVQMWTIFTALL